MNRRCLFSLPFLGAFLARHAAAQEPIVIEACAPIIGPRMPALCNSQCPSCGEFNGPVNQARASSGEFIASYVDGRCSKVLRDCQRCHGAFWQKVTE